MNNFYIFRLEDLKLHFYILINLEHIFRKKKCIEIEFIIKVLKQWLVNSVGELAGAVIVNTRKSF